MPDDRAFVEALNQIDRGNYESIAHRCARGVRGCATDDQYCELIDRIVVALAYACGTVPQTQPQP